MERKSEHQIATGNLFIGKLGINLLEQDNYGTKILDPTTLVKEVFIETALQEGSHYHLCGRYYPSDNTFKFSKCRELDEPYLDTLWITGLPLDEPIENILSFHPVHYNTYVDNHRKYLFQITRRKYA